jgi:hypothetical protein
MSASLMDAASSGALPESAPSVSVVQHARRVAYPRLTRIHADHPLEQNPLEGSRTAQEPGRKQHDAAYHPEHAVDRDAQDAERDQQNPDEWIQDQRQEGERPATHQQDAPDEKRPHA